MSDKELTRIQAGKIYDALYPMLGFLSQLDGRLAELGFSPADGYLEKVRAAREAYFRLAVETHRLSCSDGAEEA